MAIRRRKISVIGAGFTGSTTALMLAQKELGDVVLVDIPKAENPTKGKALDMLEASPVQGFDANIIGTSNYEDTKDSDLVIITAGVARKPGMSRDDLVNINAGVVRSVTEQVVKYSPDCIIIVLTNPVDAMTYEVYRTSGFPKHRVIGQSGVLDTARFRTFVAQELNVSVEDVSGFVLGGHGDDMVPLVRYSYAGGIPLEKLIPTRPSGCHCGTDTQRRRGNRQLAGERKRILCAGRFAGPNGRSDFERQKTHFAGGCLSGRRVRLQRFVSRGADHFGRKRFGKSDRSRFDGRGKESPGQIGGIGEKRDESFTAITSAFARSRTMLRAFSLPKNGGGMHEKTVRKGKLGINRIIKLPAGMDRSFLKSFCFSMNFHSSMLK